MVGILFWSMWKIRNNVVFREARFNINEIFLRVRIFFKEWDFKDKFISDNDKGK